CNRCKSWYHRTCGNISKRNYRLYQEHVTLAWVCSHCLALAEECSRLLATSTSKPGIADASQKENSAVVQNHRAQDTSVPGQGKANEGAKKRRPKKPKTLNQSNKFPDLENRVANLEKQLKALILAHDVLQKRTRHVVLHNCEEPYVKDSRIRYKDDFRRVRDILRMVSLPPNAHLVKVHRIGRWQDRTDRRPRPLRVVFADCRTRDALLAKAGEVEKRSQGKLLLTPDNATAPSHAPNRMATQPPAQLKEGKLLVTPVRRSEIKKGTVKQKVKVDTWQVPAKKKHPIKKGVSKPAAKSKNKAAYSTPIGESTPKGGSRATHINKVATGSLATKGQPPTVEKRNKTSSVTVAKPTLSPRDTPRSKPTNKAAKVSSATEGETSIVETGKKTWAMVVAQPTSSQRVTPRRRPLRKPTAVQLEMTGNFGGMLTPEVQNLCVSPRGLAWELRSATAPTVAKNVKNPRSLRPRVVKK
ncbi:MAG: hypothetical protein ABW094_19070, partial [Candidatus Thiodiazotropha sp.]